MRSRKRCAALPVAAATFGTICAAQKFDDIEQHALTGFGMLAARGLPMPCCCPMPTGCTWLLLPPHMSATTKNACFEQLAEMLFLVQTYINFEARSTLCALPSQLMMPSMNKR
jgi:hypothetical protein